MSRQEPITITHKGETKTIREWAKELGLTYGTIYGRVRKDRNMNPTDLFAKQTPHRQRGYRGYTVPYKDLITCTKCGHLRAPRFFTKAVKKSNGKSDQCVSCARPSQSAEDYADMMLTKLGLGDHE